MLPVLSNVFVTLDTMLGCLKELKTGLFQELMTEWKETDWSATVIDPTDACDVEMIYGLWHRSNATVVPIIYIATHHYSHLAIDEGIPVPFSYVPSFWFMRKFDCQFFSVSYIFL